jgi:excisionase family DNA binding protein
VPNTSGAPNGHGRRWVSVKDLAAHLGVSARGVRLMVADGRLTQYYLGPRIVRFDLDEVDAAFTPGLPPVNLPRLNAPRFSSPDQDQKRCTRCEQIRPVSAFGKDRRAGDGLRSACRACESKDARNRYAAAQGGGEP